MTGRPAAQCRAYGVCMRTLVVAYEYPWPANSGSRLRLLTTLHALCRGGPTDLFSITPDDADRLRRAGSIVRARERRPGHGPAGWGPASEASPIRCSRRRFRSATADRVSRALARFATGSYDLVWCFDVRAWVLAGTPRPGTNGARPRRPRALQDQGPPRRSTPPTVRPIRVRGAGVGLPPFVDGSAWPGRAFSQLEARRWARLYRSASTASRSNRCLQPTRRRSGQRRAACSGWRSCPMRTHVPTGRSDGPTSGRRRSSCSTARCGTHRMPTPRGGWSARLLRHCATWFPTPASVSSGWAIRTRSASTILPATTVVGPVPDIVTELSRADVVVVPVRFGSGTRVKIIEAFAHRIPVVSTTLGAEGLGVEDGRHLLLADTAQGLACGLRPAAHRAGSAPTAGGRRAPALPRRVRARRSSRARSPQVAQAAVAGGRWRRRESHCWWPTTCRGRRSAAGSSAWPRSWRPWHRWPTSTCSSSTTSAVRSIVVPPAVPVLRSTGVPVSPYVPAAPMAPGMGGPPGRPARGGHGPSRPCPATGPAGLGPSAL